MTPDEQKSIIERELKTYQAALYTVTVRGRVARAAGNTGLADAAQADAEMFQKMIDGFEQELHLVRSRPEAGHE